MIRRPPRSTRKESSAASDVYKRQPRRTFQKPQSSRHLAFLNFCSPLLDCPMRHRLSKEQWTKQLQTARERLSIWTTPESGLQIDKHTLPTWKSFSQFLPPMAWPSIWKNAFLQCPLWNSLATRFRWKVPPQRWKVPPPRRNRPPQSNSVPPLRMSSNCR